MLAIQPQAFSVNMDNDFLFIQLNDSKFQFTPVEYTIYSSDHTPMRKGRFSGKVVQLRLAHLPLGQYGIEIELAGSSVNYSFSRS
ncbi:MAG: hypothetical protein JWN76_965 [Chitinophagaceae bacterium]|nr:hypothetical protein [Chitinophagaceae bacterium]